jgi:DNA polymerase bacteriophage-type
LTGSESPQLEARWQTGRETSANQSEKGYSVVRWVCIDFETASCADLTKVGAWRYAEDTSTFVLCLGYKIVVDNEPRETVVLTEREIRDRHTELLDLVYDPNVIFVAHNAGFEQAIWQHVMVAQYGWPPLPVERWHDTMAVAARFTLPLNLDKLSATLKLNVQKDREGHALMMQMCKPNHRTGNFDHSPDKMVRLLKYNVADVDSQFEAHCNLGGLGPEERAVWMLNERVNQRGILVDEPYVRQSIGLLEAARAPMEDEFKQITGLKPSQREKVLDWLVASGANLPDLRKDTLDKVLDLENDEDGIEGISPEAYRVIQIRRILGSSSVKKLHRMLETRCFDGRVRGTMQYHGARTGRVAGRLVQPQNMPRPTVDDIPQREIMDMVRRGDMAEIDRRCGNVFDAVISTLRGCFRPGDGRVFAAGDFNAIEARVVLALAGETAKARSFDEGDPYSDMAAQIFGRPVNKKDNPDLRFVGKGTVLGAGFGMGPWKFHMVTVPDKPIDFAEQCIETYRKQWAPMVPKLWYGLEAASANAVWCNDRRAYDYRGIVYQMRGNYLVCRLPSGREIFYCDPRREQKAVPWDDTDIRPAWSYLSFQGKSAHRKTPFGGLLAENVTQAVARDIMVAGMFRCEKEGLPVVFTVHDELVTEPLASRNDSVTVLQQCMEFRDDWVREWRIPVAAECDMMLEYTK